MAHAYNGWGQWGPPLPDKWGGPPPEYSTTVWPWEAFRPRRSFCPHEDLEGATLEYDRNDGTGEHFIKLVSNIPGTDIWFGWASEAGRFDVINMTKPAIPMRPEKYTGG